MIYRVEVVQSAKENINAYIRYLAVEQRVPVTAEKMLNRIWDAIDSLEKWPRRCSKAPEDESREYEIRMLLVGQCVILFTVNDASNLVTIIAFRHGRQLPVDTLPEQVDPHDQS